MLSRKNTHKSIIRKSFLELEDGEVFDRTCTCREFRSPSRQGTVGFPLEWSKAEGASVGKPSHFLEIKKSFLEFLDGEISGNGAIPGNQIYLK